MFKVMIDNQTAVACVNHMGTSHSNSLNKLTRTLWEFCISENVFLSAAKIAGVHNVLADKESRTERKQTEWKLSSILLKQSLDILHFTPEIDMFASRTNAQYKNYVSYRCDPGAIAIDAFSVYWHFLSILCFPSFQFDNKGTTENRTRPSNGSNRCTKLANTDMVLKISENVDCESCNSTDGKDNPELAITSRNNTSAVQETENVNLPCVGEYLQNTGVSEKAKTLILGAWRKGTQKQYKTYLEKWRQYCNTTGCDSISPPLNCAINFLADLADEHGYSAVNTARSALSSVISLPDGTIFGKHPLVKKLLKGVFEKKPSLPRYSSIWDVQIVFNYIKEMSVNISLKDLTFKTHNVISFIDESEMSNCAFAEHR